MSDKFIITKKEDNSVIMTIRMEKELQDSYTELANKTGHSRNELMCMALRYALENMELRWHKVANQGNTGGAESYEVLASEGAGRDKLSEPQQVDE